MSADRGGVVRNKSGNGLQLSRTTKGIQNTRRSFRGLGKPPTLENSLGKVDRKGGLVGSGAPTVDDDLSIDDSVLSEVQADDAKKNKRQPAKQPSLLGGGGSDDDSLDDDSLRIGPGRPAKTAGNKEKAATRGGTSRSDLGLGGSSHRRSSRSNRDSLRVPRGRSRRGLNDLSSSEHARPLAGRQKKEDELSLSKSDHHRSTGGGGGKPMVRRTVSTSASSEKDASKLAVKGIYKLLNSMENKDSTKEEGLDAAQARTQVRQTIRRSKTADSKDIGQAMSGHDSRKSLQGIRNLLDKDASMRDQSMKDKSSSKDVSARERSSSSRGRRRADDSSDSDESEKNAPARSEDFGTNHSRSLQGIHKLLGSMGKDANASNKDKEKAKSAERDRSRSRSISADRTLQKSSRSMRRLQSHQLTEAKAKEEEAEEEAAANKRKEEEAAKRKEEEAAAIKRKEEEAVANRVKARKDAARILEGAASKPPVLPSEDGDDENDCDTVATPMTAAGPPPAAMKEAPPPPQRKAVARKPRNQLPNVGPQKPKFPTGSHNSAPPKVPSTPMKSPGGFVIDVKNGTTTPVAGCSTPQNLSTPQAVTLPVMPSNDSVGTPRSVVNVAPPPVTNAPPPPPKRNFDMGSRWKNRRSNVPTMPGQTTPDVCATPAAPKAPSMSMLSPGGIVIEVNKKKSGSKGPNRPPEPMTPLAEMTPMTSKEGLLSNSPHYSGLRSSMTRSSPIVPSTPAAQSRASMTNGSWMSTPSMQSCSGDTCISDLTPGTFVGRMTPSQTPRKQAVPSTPSMYNSPGIISELTPGGYSVGLYGDDDYVGSGDGAHMLTPRTHGILLEEDEEDEDNQGDPQTPLPSTPSLNSPLGVVSEMTPGTYGMDLDSKNPTKIQVGPLPVPSTPSVNNDSNTGIVSELTPGTYGVASTGRPPIPTTPSIHSPAGVVSEMTLSGSSSGGSIRNFRMLSNMSNHSGVVSDITPGSFSEHTGSVSQAQIAG